MQHINIEQVIFWTDSQILQNWPNLEDETMAAQCEAKKKIKRLTNACVI